MSREIKRAYEEVKNRLLAANVEGNTLEHATLVEGPTEDVYSNSDYPVVIYELVTGEFAEDVSFPNCARFQLKIMLTIIVDTSDGLYNEQQSGLLDYLEKVMDAIDGSDLTGSGNWGPITPQYRIASFEKNTANYQYEIEVIIQTNRYQRGNLQT